MRQQPTDVVAHVDEDGRHLQSPGPPPPRISIVGLGFTAALSRTDILRTTRSTVFGYAKSRIQISESACRAISR